MIVPFVPPPLEAGVIAHATALVRSGFQLVLLHAPLPEGVCTCGNPDCSVGGSKGESRGKHPIRSSWQKTPIQDEGQLQDELRRLKFEPNIGIVLGVQPFGAYVVAIDVDNPTRLVELEDELGQLPPTLEGRSAKGARLFFTITDPPKELQNRTGLGGAKGVDVKVKGGQVVVAPSMHGTGVRYTWTRWPVSLAELPNAWVLRIAEPKRVTPKAEPGYKTASKIERSTRERAQAYLDKCEPSISGQGGHDRAMRAATCLVRGFELDARTALELLMNGFNSRCQPPWSLKELEHKISEAAKVGDMEWGELKNTPFKPKVETSLYAAPNSEPPTDPFGVLLPIQLIFDNNAPAKIATNVARLLTEHPLWLGGPRRDLFSDRILWPDPLPEPLRRIKRVQDSKELCDEDELAIQGWLMSLPPSLRVKASKDTVHDGVLHAARWSAFDALQDRVNALPEWDRVTRLETWLSTYAGVQDTPVTRTFGRRWLISTIARVYTLGCVADSVLVLEGATGIGKNRLVTAIFGDAPWVQSIGAYKVGHDIEADWIANSSWIIHDDEMRARGSDLDALKSWISRRFDTYRKKFERNKQTYPRRAVMIASTERDHYFHDETNRRFLPVRCGTIDWVKAAEEGPQLLSEAREAYRTGESWTIGRGDPLWSEFVETQDARRVVDPFGDEIKRKLLELGMPERVTVSMLADRLAIPSERHDRALATRIGIALRESQYERRRELREGIREYIYVRRSL